MGRHSRKGKAGFGRREERARISEHPGPGPDAAARPRPGDAPGGTGGSGVPEPGVPAPGAPGRPSPSVPPGAGGRPTGPGPQGTPAHGVPAHAVGQAARGGHPQHPEGAPAPPRSRGRGTDPGGSAGRAAAGGRRSGGPRQEYLDAFDKGAFAADAPGAARPGGSRPDATAAPGGAQSPDAAAGGAGSGARQAPPEPEPESEPTPLTRKPASRARTATGIVAAAVTTVLAFIVAAQVAGGEHSSGDSGRGLKTGERAPDDPDGASGTERADRGARPAPGSSPASYGEKMARQYPLADDLEGSGRFSAVPGHQKGPGKGEVVRYRVEVEGGVPLDGELFARAVHKTLNDERSWAHDGKRSFERVSSGKARFVITLASPRTTDVWCAKSGLDTSQEKVSCDSAATDRVMINAWRWARGAETFGPDHMRAYREMLINHEVGHRLGHGHVGCPGDGKPAPVMMQQTKYLTTQGKTCRINAWPHPRG
ncbi:DUF3152 domain-containing protein [Streptomyces sp. AA1529]|uniref:DUF3152 domain-containing protein n=1 Tax=Streptomyces sp. AA1529 TaxID=1203257 RepID=UPI00030FD702